MNAADLAHEIIPGLAHLTAECDCKRVHYATHNPNDYENGELQELQENKNKYPDKYIEHNCSSVSSRLVFGKTYIIDCPCKWEEKIINVIWTNREWIIDLISRITEEKVKEAEKSTNIIERYKRKSGIDSGIKDALE